MKVGFVGLGDQGLPMAQMIAKAGFELHVWARREASLEPLEGAAVVESTPLELGRACDVVGVCLRSDDDVRDVVLGDDGIGAGLAAGSILLIHSTVLPETCIEVEAALRGRGIAVLDAPVTGGRPGALAGTLAVMVGGDAATYERVKPVFESYGTPALLGPLGSGQRMKLLNNGLYLANLRMVQHALLMAKELELDVEAAEAILLAGSGGSGALRSMIRNRDREDIEQVGVVLGKDLHHFIHVVGEERSKVLSDHGTEAIESFVRTRGRPYA